MLCRLALVASLLGGCQLYWDGPGTPPPEPLDGGPIALPDAADPLCGFVQCGAGRHCEAQCALPGTAGCVNQCHVTCVPDTPCAAIDCGPGNTCVESCLHDCQGMAWLCQQSCQPISATTCEQATSAAACQALPGCTPIYQGSGCTCSTNLCSCSDPDATYDHCRTL